jgi:hypothetical protein
MAKLTVISDFKNNLSLDGEILIRWVAKYSE